MIVLCEIFEYDKISKEYRASELGREIGFSAREINDRLYFVANEEAQKFLVSLLAPKEII